MAGPAGWPGGPSAWAAGSQGPRGLSGGTGPCALRWAGPGRAGEPLWAGVSGRPGPRGRLDSVSGRVSPQGAQASPFLRMKLPPEVRRCQQTPQKQVISPPLLATAAASKQNNKTRLGRGLWCQAPRPGPKGGTLGPWQMGKEWVPRPARGRPPHNTWHSSPRGPDGAAPPSDNHSPFF